MPRLLASLIKRFFPKRKQQSKQSAANLNTHEEDTPPLLMWRPSTLDYLRQMVLKNEAERERIGSTSIRIILILATYILPFLLAYFIGKQIGDFYAGLFSLSDGWSAGVHITAWTGEAAMAILVVYAATAWRLRRRESGYLSDLLIAASAFLVFTSISSAALWSVDEAHIKPHLFTDYAALLFLVGMVPCVDIASFLYLSLVGPLFNSPR